MEIVEVKLSNDEKYRIITVQDTNKKNVEDYKDWLEKRKDVSNISGIYYTKTLEHLKLIERYSLTFWVEING